MNAVVKDYIEMKKPTHIASTFYFLQTHKKANAEKNKKSLQSSTQEKIELKNFSHPQKIIKNPNAQC
jgi:hypothetical protein